jgi:hypothetical protein
MRLMILAPLLIAACGSTIQEVPIVETRVIEIQPPKPIVPRVDQLDLRNVTWVVLTPDNVGEKFEQIRTGELVFFAVTADGYEALALNLSDIRAMIEQQQRIIAIYEGYF